MSKPQFTDQSFYLLEELSENNNRDWFSCHKSEIAEALQKPFADVLELASSKMERSSLPMFGGRETMFRIHRDTRFSKDERPFKDNISGVLTRTGTKTGSSALLYVHLDAWGGFVAAGFYEPPTPVLNMIRNSILEQPSVFKKAFKKLAKAGFSLSDLGSTKSMPRGYADYSKHEFADVIRMKSIVVKQPLDRDDWKTGTVIQKITRLHKAAADLIFFGLQAVGEV